MRSLEFDGNTWAQYGRLEREDRKLYVALQGRIQEILREPTAGGGRPEQLKGNLSGCWSRRIDRKNRVVYRFDDDCVYLQSIRGHYGN